MTIEPRTDCDTDIPDWPVVHPESFGRIVRRYQRSIFGFFGRMGFGQTDTEELAQETFLRAWRHRDGYDPARARVSTWLFAIAHRVALDEFGRRGRRPALTADMPDHGDDNPYADPAARLAFNQRLSQLQAALGLLSESDRSVIALSSVAELSATEAADLLGCTAGAYRTRLSRARERLLGLLNQEE